MKDESAIRKAQEFYKAKHAQGLFDLLKRAIDSASGLNWLSPVFCKRGAYSFDSGKPYRGSNRFLLNLASYVLRYQSNCWITTGMLDKINRERHTNIKPKNKDERFTIVFWGLRYKVDRNTGDFLLDDDGEKIVAGMFLNHWDVYNVDNLDTHGYDLGVPDMKVNENVEEVHSMEEWEERLLTNYKNKPSVFHNLNGNRNFYRVTTDTIHLCPFNKFKSLIHFLSTYAHELVHSTGAKDRLNRKGFDVREEQTEKIYDREELVAEFGACIILAYFGFFEGMDNSAEYLKGYYSALEEKPSLLFDAYKDAEKAVAHILGITTAEL